jgi:predicted transcriptional regulator
LLRSYPMVLVAEKGNVKGIISKSDLFGVIWLLINLILKRMYSVL